MAPLLGSSPTPAAQPISRQNMLARILIGNPDHSLPSYPVMQSAEDRGFAPMPTSMGDMGARMGAVLRGQVEPTPGERYGMDVPLGWVAGSSGSARDGIRSLSNEISQEVPPMVGREGGVTTETIRRFFEDRNIPYRAEYSKSMSENFGPSASQYFKVATPDEIQTVRLSDHFYPSSAAVDLRYGQPLASAEQQLADLLLLQASPQAEAVKRAAAERAAAEVAEAQKMAHVYERNAQSMREQGARVAEMNDRWQKMIREKEEKRAARLARRPAP